MNEDYLWSKTGSDADVERLEELLSEFRYTPSRSPVSDVVEVRSKIRIAWIFAFATPAFAAILLAIWFIAPGSKGSLEARSLTPVVPPTSMGNEVVPTDVRPTATSATGRTAEKSDKVIPTDSKTFVKTVFRAPRTKKNTTRSLIASTKLTTEEQYAYDRLMLALSIAGTKLKVVQDTIDRKSDLQQRSLTN